MTNVYKKINKTAIKIECFANNDILCCVKNLPEEKEWVSMTIPDKITELIDLVILALNIDNVLNY